MRKTHWMKSCETFRRLQSGSFLRVVVFPTGKSLRYPNDETGHRVARVLIEPCAARDRLTDGIFKSIDPQDPVGRVQHALNAVIAAKEAERKLKKARIFPPELGRPGDWLKNAVAQDIVTEQEARLVERAHAATQAAIMVDDFPASRKSSPGKARARKAARKPAKKPVGKVDETTA